MLKQTLALALIAAGTAGATSAASVSYTDIAYDTASSRNVLDIHVADDSGTSPIVMFIHGGAWRGGDKSAVEGNGLQRFLDAGISVASMNHRYSSEATWPAQLDDLENAFGFLKSNGDTYGYDAGRMGAFGQSSGAHLTAVAATAFADDPSLALDAVVTQYPPTDFANMDADALETGVPSFIDHSAPDSPESQLIGAPVGDNPDLAYLASPLYFLEQLPADADLPAFLLQHGELDNLVAYPQSIRLYEALMARGGTPEPILQIFAEGTHGGGTFDEPETIAGVVDFLGSELGATPPVAPIPLPGALPLALAGFGTLAGLSLRRRA